MTTTEWRKSSFSQGGTNECVELALDSAVARVRDSKARTRGALQFEGDQFQGLVRLIKNGSCNAPS